MKSEQRIEPLSAIALIALLALGCGTTESPNGNTSVMAEPPTSEAPEWFQLRPEVEMAYGYTHAVRVGDVITISGAVSMDDKGNPTAVGDLAQQMKNCYADLHKVLVYYDCTFDDVIVENVFTTNMAGFLETAGYRSEIYTKHFPAGSWLEVKGLAVPEFLIEIELEVHKPKR